MNITPENKVHLENESLPYNIRRFIAECGFLPLKITTQHDNDSNEDFYLVTVAYDYATKVEIEFSTNGSFYGAKASTEYKTLQQVIETLQKHTP